MSRKYTRCRRTILLLCGVLLLFTCMNPQLAIADSVWETYNNAIRLEQKGKYQEAIAKYKLAAGIFLKNKEYGNAGNMHRRIANILVKLKQYDEAVEQWDKEAEYYSKAGRTQDSIAVKNRANKLRSKVSLFYETDVPAAGQSAVTNTSASTSIEPTSGAFLGAYAEQDSNVHNPATGRPFYTEQFPIATGKKHAAYLIYFTYGQPLSSIQSHINSAKANGTALEIGLQPLKGLGSVKDDEYLRGLARDAAAAGIPIFLRFANEMNGKWVPWFTTPEVYIEKFRLVADVFHQEAPHNVAMVWAPGSEPEDTITDYYPGDNYVDWVGVSLYSIYNPTSDPLHLGEDRSSHIEKLDTIYRLYGKRKPIMIAEGGISYMHPEKKADKTDWAIYRMRELYSTLPMLYPNVKAVFWFDANAEGERIKYYQLTANPKLLQAYKESISSPYYRGTIGEQSPIAYKPVAGASIPAKELKLSGYVKTWSPMIAKVTYEIGGKVVGETTTPPWTAAINFAMYRGKTINIVVKAYDSKGTLLLSKTVRTTVQK